MTTKHTPGPWEIEARFSYVAIITEGKEYVATVSPDYYTQERWDNARLIAAAPELLAFAELVRDFFTDDSLGHAQYLKEQAEVAIAKATGNK